MIILNFRFLISLLISLVLLECVTIGNDSVQDWVYGMLKKNYWNAVWLFLLLVCSAMIVGTLLMMQLTSLDWEWRFTLATLLAIGYAGEYYTRR